MDYDFRTLEKKWQAWWDEHRTFKVTEDPAYAPDRRLYVLDMFPYPSGAGLHVGHPEGYTATDIYSRCMRMKGFNVLHPMGFDSFGLPAENYAIKTGTHPKITTEKNINAFRRQIKSLGFSYDWDREISTCTPEYYRWTQWFFLQLYKKGLAYEGQIPINWCPSCKTGLANEEVKEGHCERCGSQVYRRNMRQWVLKITDYAERLLADIDKVNWPEPIKIMQRNWIGKSVGAEVNFGIDGRSDELTVYTTRPDTLYGVTYMVLSPEHPLVKEITAPQCREAVERYVQQAALKSDLERTDLNKDKTGVFTGAYAVHPLNGAKIPIWISDYVLISYGTGAIMAVPAHDSRDWEFAVKFNLPVVEVVSGGDVQHAAYEGDGPHVNSDFMNGLNTSDAVAAALERLEACGKGKKAVNYKLRDWIFSRQRYWGEPIPLIHCPHCGTVPVPEDELPLRLPEVNKYEPTGTGESPLAGVEDWVNCTCPVCGAPARRETNTMPQWAGSCWYYLRYLDPHNDKAFADRSKIDYWMPVDLYVGGAEHAVLHLLYARFWHKVLFDLGLVNTDEPFARLVNQGMITSFAYQRPDKSLVPVDQVEEPASGVFIEKGTKVRLERVVSKMSKSLKNVINPDEIVERYGADTLRLYEMFMGPLQMSKPWSTQGLQGVHRFLQKVWKVCTQPLSDAPLPPSLNRLLHKTVKKVGEDTEALSFNTAISQMMVLINEAAGYDCCYRRMADPFVRMLSCYAPHMGEELWTLLGNEPSVSKASWPVYDEDMIADATTTVPVQFNGKVREKLLLPAGLDKEALLKAVLENDAVRRRLEGLTVVKTVVVPGKLVNLVVK